MIIKTQNETVHLNTAPTTPTVNIYALVDDGTVIANFSGVSLTPLEGGVALTDADGSINCIIWGKPGQWLQFIGEAPGAKDAAPVTCGKYNYGINDFYCRLAKGHPGGCE